jgi:methionyl-tRNA synthetase
VEDLDLSFDDFVNRVNADLVNTIANIPSRVLAILHKNCGGKLTGLDEGGRALVTSLQGRVEKVASLYEVREFSQVTRLLIELAGEINLYLQEHKPWQLAKEGQTDRAAVVCTSALNAYKIVATLIQPILPHFGSSLAKVLGLDSLRWDALGTLHENQPVGEYERLVDRVDRKKIEAIVAESRETLGPGAEVEAPVLTLDGLVDVELQTMKVLDVKRVEKSEKLIDFTLEQPQGGQRHVLAGIGWNDQRAALKGHNLFIVANLEPKKLAGQESQGMSLAAKTGDGFIPLQPADEQANLPVE